MFLRMFMSHHHEILISIFIFELCLRAKSSVHFACELYICCVCALLQYVHIPLLLLSQSSPGFDTVPLNQSNFNHSNERALSSPTRNVTF